MTDNLRASYDTVAGEYRRRIADELDGKPFDRAILARFARRAGAEGAVWELGCGPAHVAAFLLQHGACMAGLDLSPNMLLEARRLFPALPLVCADMNHLPTAAGTLAGIVAMYSVIHTPVGQLGALFHEFLRALRPGAPLLVSFHMGSGPLHLTDWWDLPVNIDFHFFNGQQVNDSLRAAGFTLEEYHERAPYPGVEHSSRRGYVIASRPG